ncbi:MAG: nucleotide sugar dehydrogenase [bacterium]
MIMGIKNRCNFSIGIIGLGYVGLPLAVEFANKGFSVTGFEIDKKKINSILAGKSYIDDVPSDIVKLLVNTKKMTATSNFAGLHKMKAVIICVPTPLRKTKDPDISYIISSVKKVIPHLKKGQMIILESTTYPGTTREIVLPMLEKSGLRVGKDFYLAFSPERVDPGNKIYTIKNTPKVVGGITPKCSQYAHDLYSFIVDTVVTVSSTEAAEMVKLLENTFRAVNIGLVNEVALMCNTLHLDTWEIIDAAASKPFGFMPFYPGPGIGGHCIPLDPHYLSWKLKMLNFYARFIELAADINSKMPEYLVKKITDALNERSKSIKNSKLLILGISYKKDVGDVRESPALDVIELLQAKQAKISYHDPYINKVTIKDTVYKSCALNNKILSKYDCVIIATHHSVFNIPEIVKNAGLVIDARNATKGIKSKHIVKL